MAKWSTGWNRSPTSNTASKSGDLTQRVEGVHMATRSDALKDRLSRYREINISVTGRKSGRAISRPVWFVLDGDKLYLLPVQGSDTQWYKNVLKEPTIRVDARGAAAGV